MNYKEILHSKHAHDYSHNFVYHMHTIYMHTYLPPHTHTANTTYPKLHASEHTVLGSI